MKEGKQVSIRPWSFPIREEWSVNISEIECWTDDESGELVCSSRSLGDFPNIDTAIEFAKSLGYEDDKIEILEKEE